MVPSIPARLADRRRVFRRLLELPPFLERFVLLLRPDGDRPPGVPLRRPDALVAAGTAPAVFGGELDLDDAVGAFVDRRRPADAGFPPGAGRPLPLPIDGE